MIFTDMGPINGVYVENVSYKAIENYLKKVNCPECDSELVILKPAWKLRSFIYTSKSFQGVKTECISAQCPICGTYFNKEFEPLRDRAVIEGGIIHYDN